MYFQFQLVIQFRISNLVFVKDRQIKIDGSGLNYDIKKSESSNANIMDWHLVRRRKKQFIGFNRIVKEIPGALIAS